MRKRMSAAAVLFAAASLTHGATQYWDVNGAGAGFGGSGTWDVGATANWNDLSGTASPQVWVQGNDAVFNQSAASTTTIASGATINANSLSFASTITGIGTITGGTALNLASTAGSIVMSIPTTGQIVNANLGGTDITVVTSVATNGQTTLLNLGGTNNFTGNLILAGGGTPANFGGSNKVSINSAGALPATASVLFARNWSQLDFTAGTAGTSAYTATFGNNINLNSSGSGTFTSGLGASISGTVVTLNGVISGNANLTFGVGTSGGQGTIVVANHATYTGNTVMQMASSATTSGVVRLGINDALPTGTRFTQGNTSGAGSGTFDLGGFNQTVAGIESLNNAAVAGFIGGITNTSATTSTLTISGNLSTSYGNASGANAGSANIGAATSSAVSGSNDHIALNLDSANTGTLSLVRPTGNTYDGGTTVNGGTLLVANTSGSGTGTGPVTVGAGGSFGGTGIVTGHADSSGMIIPGGAGAVGTLTLSGGLAAHAGSGLSFEFGSGGNDKVTLGGANDATIFSAPGGSQSVSLKLIDLGSGFSNNTTYTLFNYPSGAFSATDPTTAFSIVKPTTGTATNATFTLSNDSASGAIKVFVTGVGTQRTWIGGATGSGTWDVGTTANWSGSATFSNGDVVTFDDSANAGDDPVVVTIAGGGVVPGNTVVNAGARGYTIQGGPIAGGSVMKNGTGTLVLGSANTYAGGTVVSQGTLAIAGDSSLGAVPATPTVNLSLAKTLASTSVLRFDGDTTLNANRTILVTQSNGGGPNFDTNGHDVTIAGQILGGTAAGVNFVKIGAGTLTLAGDNSTNNGGGYLNAVLVNGGTLKASQDVSLGKLGSPVNLNNGTFQFGASFNPAGRNMAMNGVGGTVDTNGFNATIDGIVSGGGAFAKVGAGTLTLVGANTLTGTTVVNGGVLVLKSAAWGPVLTNTPGGADVTSGKLVFDYTGTSSPAGTVVPLLKSSHDSSNFTDTAQRLRTSNAADPNHGLGYLDDGTSKLTVMYTWYGDANLDGTVNGDDYALLDRAAAKGLGASWVNGDFNFDGSIDAADYLAIDTSYGKITGQLPEPLLAAREAQFGAQYVAELIAAVPEPASLGVLMTLVPVCLGRRRRAGR